MPDLWMDVDAALSEVPVNIAPLIDDTDFKSRETAIAYNASGMDLVWNFVTTAGVFTQTAVTPTTGGDYDWTHQGDGMYTIEIPASGGASINNDTEGFGWFTGFVTGVLPWRGPTIGFRAAGLNNKLIDDAYSTTRGLGGTALPDAAAEASGGLYTRGTGAGQIAQDSNGTARVRLADAAHGGTAAVLTLERLVAVSTTSNEPGIKASGNGTAAGIQATGGATGAGIAGTGGATSGVGIAGTGTAGNSQGMLLAGQGSAEGMRVVGGATGNGLTAAGGISGGDGISAAASAGNGRGINAAGQGSGAGLRTVGGATGPGIQHTGGSTSGDAVATSVTSGSANVPANVKAISDDATAADNLETACDGGSYNVGGGAVVAASVTGAVGSVTGNVGGSVGSLATQAKADVNAECDSALADYDAPTKAELDTLIGTPAGADVSADIAAVKAQTAAIETDTQAIETDTQDIQSRLPAALTAGGNMKADALAISGNTGSADKLEESTSGIVTATCDTGGTTTSIVVSALSPASSVNDQFNGRIITFADDTTTAALRGQSTDITDFVHATQTFTVTALTTGPASGDTFVIT